jgi:MFS transporter, DHA1 family, inner membrane transport protein
LTRQNAAQTAIRTSDAWLLIGCGVVAAAQIGKAIISMPVIRVDLGLGLDVAGLIVATFAALGASFGIGAGVTVQRIGVRRSLVGGMVAIALGNAIGSAASSEIVLLVARIVEGTGFFGVVLAIPSLLARIGDPKERDFVMAAWSAYMPAGIMLMLLIGPLLPLIGWRQLWIASASIAVACAGLLAARAPTGGGHAVAGEIRFFSEAASVLRDRRCVILAFAFFAYSCQIFSMAFALPLLLTSTHGLPIGSAGLLSAAVLAVSTAGHILSGFLLRAGVPIWASIAAAFGGFAFASLGVYSEALQPSMVAALAAVALGIGGIAPGALYAAAPRAASNPRVVPSVIGLLQQASNLGQFTGPVVLALWVDHFGWSAAPAIVVPMALIGLAAAIAIRGLTREPLDKHELPRDSAVKITAKSSSAELPLSPRIAAQRAE